MNESQGYIIEPSGGVGVRVDVFVAEQLADLSRSGVQKLIESNAIMVNEKPTKANYKLRLGDAVAVCVPEAVALKVEAENIPLDILYEDNALIVVNKPKGMVVHPAAGHQSGTLVNALLHHCGATLSGINGVMRPGIIHRIDKDTTGALLVAKTNLSHQHLSAQLAQHTVTRVYHAIVCDGMAQNSGTVDKPIGRHPTDRKKMAITDKNAKHAITHYTVLERLGKYTLIEARLETGRTHQIRVHMASIGHPVLGDLVYGSRKSPFNTTGQVLHAKTLGFVHPTSGLSMLFEAPLPNEFLKILKILRTYSELT